MTSNDLNTNYSHLRLDHIIRTSRRKKDAQSPAQQRQVGRTMVGFYGYQIVKEHDSGKSEPGGSMEREALKLFRKRLDQGLTDGAFVSYVNRIGRAPIEESMGFIRDLIDIGGGQFVAADFMGGVPVDLKDPNTEQFLTFQLANARGEAMTIGKRFNLSQANAVAQGWWVGTIPPGYIHPEWRSPLQLEPKTHHLFTQMFKMRLTGATGNQLWQYLYDNWPQEYLDDPPRKDEDPPYPGSPQPPAHPGGIRQLLKSVAYVGDIKRGGNGYKKDAHPAIIDRTTFKKVQDMRVTRGSYGKSNRLLARLGVLVCANCDGRMCVSPAKNGYYPAYKCVDTPLCPGYNTIGADHAERVIWEWVLNHDGKGKGNKAESARKVAQQAARDQEDYDNFVADYDPSEPADRARKAELKAIKDASQELSNRLGDGSTLLRRKVRDLNDLERDEKRQLILDNVKFARVHPFESHGKKRIEIVGISESLGDFV